MWPAAQRGRKLRDIRIFSFPHSYFYIESPSFSVPGSTSLSLFLSHCGKVKNMATVISQVYILQVHAPRGRWNFYLYTNSRFSGNGFWLDYWHWIHTAWPINSGQKDIVTINKSMLIMSTNMNLVPILGSEVEQASEKRKLWPRKTNQKVSTTSWKHVCSCT